VKKNIPGLKELNGDCDLVLHKSLKNIDKI